MPPPLTLLVGQSRHPSYYTKARKARDRVSSFASPEAKSPEEGLRLLRCVLEDYLEVDHDTSPVREVMPTSALKKYGCGCGRCLLLY